MASLEASLEALHLSGQQVIQSEHAGMSTANRNGQAAGSNTNCNYPDAKDLLHRTPSLTRDKVMLPLDAAWAKISSHEHEAMKKEPGGSFATWRNNVFGTCYANYSSLSFQREYVQRKFEQTAENVYDALVKAKKQLCFNLGSFPEIVILGCGPAPEIVAVKVFLAEHLGITSARFSTDWGLAWSPLTSLDFVKHDNMDLEAEDQDWWDQLRNAKLIIGWYVHEVLQDKLTLSMLEKLVGGGAVVILGCPAAGRSFFATQARYQSSTLTAIELGAFDRERGYLFYRPMETLKESGLYPKSQKWPSATARQQSISQQPNLADQTLNITDPMSINTYLTTIIKSALKKKLPGQYGDVPLLTDLKKAIAEVDAHHVRHMQDVNSLESAFATISPNNSKSSCDYPSHARG